MNVDDVTNAIIGLADFGTYLAKCDDVTEEVALAYKILSDWIMKKETTKVD